MRSSCYRATSIVTLRDIRISADVDYLICKTYTTFVKLARINCMCSKAEWR